MNCNNKPLTPKEDVIHRQCIEWFYLRYRSSGAVLHHSPNENPRGNQAQMIRYNGKMKSLGRLAGFPDVAIYHKSKTLFIEIKTATGKQSPAQRDAAERLNGAGFEIEIVRSVDDFAKVVGAFLS